MQYTFDVEQRDKRLKETIPGIFDGLILDKAKNAMNILITITVIPKQTGQHVPVFLQQDRLLRTKAYNRHTLNRIITELEHF